MSIAIRNEQAEEELGHIRPRAFPGRIIFDHLPKTAGTSVNTWLRESLGDGCVTPPLIDWHRDLIQHYGGIFSVISGHVKYSPGEGLDPRYQYVTCFREPVDRAISWIYFVLNHKADLPEKPGVRAFLEGRDWENLPILGHFRNLITEHFSGIFNLKRPRDEADKIAEALKAVQRYDVVGLYGDLLGFMVDFSALLGVPAPAALPTDNVTKSRPKVGDLDPAMRARLVGLNQLDLRLYEKIAAWKSSTTRLGALPSAAPHGNWAKYDGLSKRKMSRPGLRIAEFLLRNGTDIAQGGKFHLDLKFLLSRKVESLAAGVMIHDKHQQLWFETAEKDMVRLKGRAESGVYHADFEIRADLPPGEYLAGLTIVEETPHGMRVLAYQEKSSRFTVYGKRGLAGKVSLPVKARVRRLPPDEVGAMTSAAGRMHVGCAQMEMVADSMVNVPAEVQNDTPETWDSMRYAPVRISYHWLSASGDVVVMDGVRTSLPEGGIPAGGRVPVSISVQAPAEPGNYRLMLTMVQEGIMWFENAGFAPAVLDVSVRHG